MNTVLVLAVTIAAGAATYYAVEKPVMNYAKRVRAARKAAKKAPATV